MNAAAKAGLILVSVIALVWGCSPSDRSHLDTASEATAPQPSARGPNQSALLAAVERGVAASPKWGKLEAEQKRDGYRLTLKYRDMPSGMREVEKDTRAIAQAALDSVVAAGRNPHEEQLFLSVWANRPERGATRAEVVRMFGRARYNWSNDQIEFEPYK